MKVTNKSINTKRPGLLSSHQPYLFGLTCIVEKFSVVSLEQSAEHSLPCSLNIAGVADEDLITLELADIRNKLFR